MIVVKRAAIISWVCRRVGKALVIVAGSWLLLTGVAALAGECEAILLKHLQSFLY